MSNVSKEDITNFFTDIKDMFAKEECNLNCSDCNLEECIKPPQLTSNNKDEVGQQRTNVIYLNTDCNLRCEYCYEGDSRNGLPDQSKCTTNDIDSFLNEICQREKENKSSTIVIMGGEPFLNFDLIEYTIFKAASLSINKTGGWGISLITNGTLFTDNILTRYKEVVKLTKFKNVNISLEVSYDVSGQYRRKWPDGSNSKKQTEKGIQKLIDLEIPFKISYTVHSGNCTNIVKDCIYLLEKYPLPYFYRMTASWAYQDIDKIYGEHAAFDFKKQFKEYACELYRIYGVPICDSTCDLCNICDKSNFSGNSYLSPTTGISYDEKQTEHIFQQF